MPGFSLLSESKTVLSLLLPAFSPLFPVPKNRFSLVKLLPDWKTFWPCFAAGFCLSFYPFGLPCHIYILYEVTLILLLPAFSPLLLSRGHVQKIMHQIGRGFPVLTLQLIPKAFLSCRTVFSQPAFLLQNRFVNVVANTFFSAPCPEGLTQFGTAAISLVFFPNSPLQVYSSVFPLWRDSPVVAHCSVPEFASILLLPTFSSLIPVPKDWFGFACFYRIGKLLGFLPCGWILSVFPPDRACLYQTHSNRVNVPILQLPSGFLHFPCHQRQILLSIQNLIPTFCCQMAFLFFIVIKDRTEFVRLLRIETCFNFTPTSVF